jgi:hypothetical protein
LIRGQVYYRSHHPEGYSLFEIIGPTKGLLASDDFLQAIRQVNKLSIWSLKEILKDIFSRYYRLTWDSSRRICE